MVLIITIIVVIIDTSKSKKFKRLGRRDNTKNEVSRELFQQLVQKWKNPVILEIGQILKSICSKWFLTVNNYISIFWVINLFTDTNKGIQSKFFPPLFPGPPEHIL